MKLSTITIPALQSTQPRRLQYGAPTHATARAASALPVPSAVETSMAATASYVLSSAQTSSPGQNSTRSNAFQLNCGCNGPYSNVTGQGGQYIRPSSCAQCTTGVAQTPQS